MESGSCCGAPYPKRAEVSWATFSPRAPSNHSPLAGMKEERQMKAAKRGRLPWSCSCLPRHPPGGKFNKVHIPRATQERDENTWKERRGEEETEGWRWWLTPLPRCHLRPSQQPEGIEPEEAWWNAEMPHANTNNADTKNRAWAPTRSQNKHTHTHTHIALTQTHRYAHVHLSPATIPAKLANGLYANFKNRI